jgi:hypothetical protein
MHHTLTRSRALLGAVLLATLAACGGGSDASDPAHQRASLIGPARAEMTPGAWSGAQTSVHQVGELDLSYTNSASKPVQISCSLTGAVALDAGGGFTGGRVAGVQLVLNIGGLPLPPATLAPGATALDGVQISAMVPAGKLATCTTWLRIYTLSAGVQAAPAAALSLSDAIATLEVQP